MTGKDFIFNPFDAEFRTNPYPTYHYLQQHHPFHFNPALQRWIVTRYSDALTVLQNSQFRDCPLDRGDSITAKMMAQWLFFQDPPQHTHLRKLFHMSFNPQMVKNLKPVIQKITNTLLDAVAPQRTCDLLADFSYPLPIAVISHILGVPTEDHAKLIHLSQKLAGNIECLFSRKFTEIQDDATTAFLDYFTHLISKRRAEPGHDLISHWLSLSTTDHQPISIDVFAANCVMLLFAGHETTANLIGNGVLALLQNPEQLASLKNNFSLIDACVEECLRYDTPAQIVGRLAFADLEVGAAKIPQGQRLIIYLGAANRDPAQFPEPDRFDITRANKGHLTFGIGQHFCMGAALVRMEVQVALYTLITRFANLKLVSDTVEWRNSLLFRGLTKLQLSW